MTHDGSPLAKRVALEDAWEPTGHSEVCCLIHATQNGWKLPILFEQVDEKAARRAVFISLPLAPPKADAHAPPKADAHARMGESL